MREHDVAALTAAELKTARRELAASLALARPGSPVRVPIQARMAAIDAELAGRAAARLTRLPARPAPGRRAGGLRRDAPAPRCRGVLVPGIGGLLGIPRTSSGGRGQMAYGSGRVPAPSCTWII
jgi:hypothetical protein